MSINEVLIRLSTESRNIRLEQESKEKVKKILEKIKVRDTVDANLDIERIRFEHNRLMKEWEHIIEEQGKISVLYERDNKKYADAFILCQYEFEKRTLYCEAYAKILNEQHHADELMEKLRKDLKKLDEKYYKTQCEQLRLEV